MCSNLKTGSYRFECLVGQYPKKIWCSYFFTFHVLEEAGYLRREGRWFSYGQSFTDSTVYLSPADFGLEKNPFHPRMDVSIFLPKSCRVNIDIIDVNGSFASHFFEGDRPVGLHQIKLNAIPIDQLQSGIYFLRYQADDFTFFLMRCIVTN